MRNYLGKLFLNAKIMVVQTRTDNIGQLLIVCITCINPNYWVVIHNQVRAHRLELSANDVKNGNV